MQQNYKKILLGALAFIAVSLFVFYLLNFNFKGNFTERFRSFCEQNFGEKHGIPQSWLDRYEIVLENDSDVKADVDGDGLDVLAEYQNSTNPLNPDTDGDGFNDGKEVRDGYSPIGEGKLDQDGDGLPDFWEEENGLSTKEKNADADPDGDGLPNQLEFAYLTNPLKKDSDGDVFTDLEEIENGYDPTVAGDARLNFSISISKINVEAPIVWSESDEEADLLKDLEKGVAILSKTGVPGQSGNTVISGHSSNYIWAKGDYNYIFENLNNLEIGDKITIKATGENNRSFAYSYVITSKNVVKPNDPMIFQETEATNLTLVTCWPLRTTWNRLVVKAELEK